MDSKTLNPTDLIRTAQTNRNVWRKNATGLEGEVCCIFCSQMHTERLHRFKPSLLTKCLCNVAPGVINFCLEIWGCPWFWWESSLLEGNTLILINRGVLIRVQHQLGEQVPLVCHRPLALRSFSSASHPALSIRCLRTKRRKGFQLGNVRNPGRALS